ncbi:hypothetical protein P7C70_g6603, partial [Phenoliferia sp. Uapishka_3]
MDFSFSQDIKPIIPIPIYHPPAASTSRLPPPPPKAHTVKAEEQPSEPDDDDAYSDDNDPFYTGSGADSDSEGEEEVPLAQATQPQTQIQMETETETEPRQPVKTQRKSRAKKIGGAFQKSRLKDPRRKIITIGGEWKENWGRVETMAADSSFVWWLELFDLLQQDVIELNPSYQRDAVVRLPLPSFFPVSFAQLSNHSSFHLHSGNLSEPNL